MLYKKIDKKTFLQNYSRLNELIKKFSENDDAFCAPVLKFDAYGTGFENLPLTQMIEDGCEQFFVQDLKEALRAKELIKSKKRYKIYFYFGLIVAEKDIKVIQENNDVFVPIISSLDMLKKAKDLSIKNIGLFFDTGFSFLGIDYDNKEKVIDFLEKEDFNVSVVISHFTKENAKEQKDKFDTIKALIEKSKIAGKDQIKYSISASNFMIYKQPFVYDFAQTGMALFGYLKTSYISPVLEVSTEILEIKKLKKGQSIGYRPVLTLEKDTNVALLSSGYGDGLLEDLTKGCNVIIKTENKTFKAKILKVVMNMIMVDIKDNKIDDLKEAKAYFLNEDYTIYDMANDGGLRPGEILTNLLKNAKIKE